MRCQNLGERGGHPPCCTDAVVCCPPRPVLHCRDLGGACMCTASALLSATAAGRAQSVQISATGDEVPLVEGKRTHQRHDMLLLLLPPCCRCSFRDASVFVGRRCFLAWLRLCSAKSLRSLVARMRQGESILVRALSWMHVAQCTACRHVKSQRHERLVVSTAQRCRHVKSQRHE